MADLNTIYTLATPGGTVTFNNGDLFDGTDKFWIQEISGLDGIDVRAPVDNVPFGHGGILHAFWRAPRQLSLDGVLLVESVPSSSSSCPALLNTMEEALRAAVDSLITASGTLSWTPAGQSAKSLTVFHHGQPRLDFRPVENYALRQFVFGLISASPTL